MRIKRLLFLFLPCLLVSCEATVSKQYYDTRYECMVSAWNTTLKGRHYDNVFYGDSRVSMGDFNGAFPDKSIINLGVGGDRTQDMFTRYCLIDTVTPKKVFLFIGGNDAQASDYSLSTYKSKLTQLIDKFIADKISVVITNSPGLTTAKCSVSENTISNINNKMKEINSVMLELCTNYTIPHIDLASALNDPVTGKLKDEYTIDGAHFSEAAYKVWYQLLDGLII